MFITINGDTQIRPRSGQMFITINGDTQIRPRSGQMFIEKWQHTFIRPLRGRTSSQTSRFYKYAIPSGLKGKTKQQNNGEKIF